MQAAHRVAKNTGILYARMAITVFISLYATRLVLAALGVADFGLFNVVGGVIAMLGFLNSSMAAATQRFMSFAQGAGDLEKVKRIFNMSTVLHAGIAVLMVLVLEITGYFFLNEILNIAPDRLEVAKIIYHFMVISTFFTVLSVPYEAVITSHENMLFYAILGILESVLKLGIALYLSYSAFDHLIAYGFLMAALSIFLLILRRIYCHRTYAECVLDFRKYYEKNLMKEISSFAGWSLLDSSSSMISNFGQGLILNVFFGTLINAAQGIALQICGQLAAFSNTMLKALNPLIDKSAGARNKELVIKITFLGCKISYLLFAILVIPVIIELPYIFKIWLNTVPNYAVIFCRLLLIRTLIEMMFVSLSSSINAFGNIKKIKIYSSLINILPLIISYFLFKNAFPPYSLYIVFIFISIIIAFTTLYFANKFVGISLRDFFFDVISKCVVVTVLTSTTLLLPIYFFEEGLLRLCICLISAFSSFLFFVWNFGFKSEERKIIQQLIQTQILNKISPDIISTK
jgi:Na+-driven multidrug efflux pump